MESNSDRWAAWPPGSIRVQKKKIILPDRIPTIEGIYTSENAITLLACGSNQKLADTIILIHVDVSRKKVIFIGIPRDLYYRGRKINTVNSIYGTERLISELTDITGLHIEKYMVIDMFALAEVIDIMGGIDVTLEEDLIDPTYKIKEEGVWSTLYYPQGTYHLNGIQALRVARSRNFSSDFDRARRQQKILESLTEKLRSIGIQNLDKVYELIKTLFNYVETNAAPFELVNYFNRFKDYRVVSQNVLDTGNILYETYSNIYLLSEAVREQNGETFDRGSYILLPRDDDWNLIKWYIRTLIETG